MKPKALHEIFGSFFLNGNEFAISVRSVQEVVNEPTMYTPVPLCPDYLLGLFNLRGTIVPVIDLSKILRLGEPEKKKTEKKIAIVEHGNFCVGLLFDKTGEVFSSQSGEKSEFNIESPDIEGQIVKGVFKLDNGQRIVQILDPTAILSLDRLPQSAKVQEQRKVGRAHEKHGKRCQAVSFLVGDAFCGMEMSSIQEILSVEKIDTNALATEKCIGAFNLRGSTVPLIDFGSILGYREPDRSVKATQGERKVIVLKHPEGLFGLLVDAVHSIVTYFEDEVVPFPVFGKARPELFNGCILGEQDIILLNSSKVLDHKDVESVTRGNSRLFQKQDTSMAKSRSGKNRQTYISFTIDNTFAVDIREVKEVIDNSSELLHPPGLSNQFCGVLNLRGDMIAIVDTRQLYSLPAPTQIDNTKIMIFELADFKYGLIVDSVDSIIRFSPEDQVRLPEILYRGVSGQMTKDVKNAVEILIGERRQTFLLLNMESVSKRLAMGA
ncbi:MAG: chemotaxis protein CheW [Pseudomonadota bacterium]